MVVVVIVLTAFKRCDIDHGGPSGMQLLSRQH